MLTHLMNATDSSSVAAPSFFQVAVFNAYVIVGPVVLGALIDACLFGCLIIQTYVYYANFANDHRAIKLTVAAVFATQIAHVICVSATLWYIAVSAYDDSLKLQTLPLGADATILFTGITGALVESYFAFRLWKLSKRLPLVILSLVLCAVAQVISIVVTAKAVNMTSVAAFEIDQNVLITLSLTSRVLCDLILTLSIAWYVRKQRSGFARQATFLPIRSVVTILQDDEHD
ncbi:hypothetical protein DEU56DRAFT_910711 [Suillus clintonianus]|uniref:uncharacterized protein n=1 Tax=Suillus clintonianus TaxID=1904413 RepID=UPI001B866269|nr:uncharacterized protein DEU56DRAFT_910711 [Suillus clintonianus]KAG2143577.1 hypothetical protein DEU56DRAFT_910711 [Suillus clintonianus]